ncbi:MAG: MBL fold metallo-hydrolase [Gammaproteobacteria bacterium]|nr:MBL fold metallo-hydrolase [Gammaproteobacteria bacterium]
MKPSFSVTRVINACVLLQFGEDFVLTDPYFDNHWYWKWNEPIGMTVEQLPKLSAIIGGHSVFDHWQIGALKSYEHKDQTPVFVATKSMARKARAAGFRQVEVMEWNDRRCISSELSLEAVTAQRSAGLKVNNYVLSTPGLRVFFGSETLDLEPLRAYRQRIDSPCVDVVLAPVNGARLLNILKLVMNGRDAVEATRILGSKTLVAIHDSQIPVPFLFGVPSSGAEAEEEARRADDVIDVVRLAPGQEWEYHST